MASPFFETGRGESGANREPENRPELREAIVRGRRTFFLFAFRAKRIMEWGEIGVFSRVFPIFCRRMFFNDGANGRDRRNRMPERFHREAFRDEARLVHFSSSVRWETVFSFRLHGDSANV